MSDLVLVTGISGFLGGHVALQLLEAGYRVRGSVRNLCKADKVRATLAHHGADIARLEFVALDLLSDAGWTEAMDGARYLQHVASPLVIETPKDRNDLIRPAVEGTERALKAALGAGVERIVLTSSMAAIMYGGDPKRTAPYTANDWTRLDGRDVTAYVESKTRAERRAWEIMSMANRSADLATINPGVILGPLLDDDTGTSAVLVQRLLDGSVPALPDIELVIVDVRDVAALHVTAMTANWAGGHRFPTGAGSASLAEIATQLRAARPALANRIPKYRVPNWLVRLMAVFDADMRGNVGELGAIRRADARDAEQLLGRPFIPIAEALGATADTLVTHGLIDKKRG